MRNLTTYRICAGAAIALILLGVLRNEIWTVVLGGLGALYCLRWARIEREDDERRRVAAYERRLQAGRYETPTFRIVDRSETVRPRK